MMRIIKTISKILICVLCVLCLHTVSFAAGNVPAGEIQEYGDWMNPENMQKVNDHLSSDMNTFQQNFQNAQQSTTFVPLEAKLSLAFMRALSAVDTVLQSTLVKFTIIFLFIMYAFWVSIEAYKMVRESTDYKQVIFDIFKKGITIAVWVIVLHYGPAKIFTMIVGPIITLGTYLSDFILDVVAKTYNTTIPDTCKAIHQYVDNNSTTEMLINSDTAANIMCLSGRISAYFYKALSVSLQWIAYGLGRSATAVAVGVICCVIFIKCIFKYAFMMLGVVADLFLTLLMLPFTALSEAMPTTSEKNYAGQVFSGFLKIFNTKKLSDVIYVFINAAIFFISLSIVISICASLLINIISPTSNGSFVIGSAMTTILCGCLVLYLAGKAEDFAKQMGGSVDNSFGKQLQNDAKTVWNKAKGFGTTLFKAWSKSK